MQIQITLIISVQFRNLPFYPGKVVAAQVHDHLSVNNLYEQFKSGFLSYHSTETVLIKTSNDLLVEADSGPISILIILDLTSAFDNISHEI